MSLFVLKNSLDGMLIGELGLRNHEGIYEEVQENNLTKAAKDALENNFASYKCPGLIKSNTRGITCGKYFKKVAEPLDFEPIMLEDFNKLKDDNINKEWAKVIHILEKTDCDSIYRLRFETSYNDKINLKIRRVLNEKEIKVIHSEFSEFEENFRGLYEFEVNLCFIDVSTIQMEKIKSEYKGRRIHLSLEELKNLVSKYSLKFRSSNYYKELVYNFRGNHTKGIDVFNSLNEIMTLAEASQLWGLGESTLRSTVRTDKLVEGVDYKKSGKVWLITKDAMTRIYGEPKTK